MLSEERLDFGFFFHGGCWKAQSWIVTMGSHCKPWSKRWCATGAHFISDMIQGKNMFLRRRISRALTILLSSLMASTGQATTVQPMNIVDLIDHSETIVAGRVEKVTDGFTADGMPYTEVTVHVIDRFRGASGNTFTFRQFGLSAPRTMPNGKVYLGGRPKAGPPGTSAK